MYLNTSCVRRAAASINAGSAAAAYTRFSRSDDTSMISPRNSRVRHLLLASNPLILEPVVLEAGEAENWVFGKPGRRISEWTFVGIPLLSVIQGDLLTVFAEQPAGFALRAFHDDNVQRSAVESVLPGGREVLVQLPFHFA